jgi:succinoglycan biosynthesis transport protein ExoP
MNSAHQHTDSHIPVLRDEIHHGQQLAIHDPYANAYVPEDEIDLREIWNVITKHKGLILTVFSLFLITTIVATLLMRPVYRAEALIEIQPDIKSLVKFDSLEQANSQPLEYKTTQQNIISSNSVATAVIEKLNLQKNPEINGTLDQRGFVSGIKEIISSFRGNDEEKLPVIEEDEEARRVNRFKDRLNVSAIRKSDLFKISFDSFDPRLAAIVANTTVSEFVRLDRQRRLDSNSDAKHFLQTEISATQAKLESSEKDLTEFARRSNIVDVEEKGNIMVQRLSDLNSQLTMVTGERVAAEALWLQAQGPDGAQSLPNVLTSTLINELKRSQADLKSEYFNLSKIYKPAYPALQQAKAQLDDINNSIDLEIQRQAKGLEINYKQLVAKEGLLDGKVEEQKQALLSIKDKSIQYNILKREWETNKELYTGLLESMKQVGVAGGMEPNNISLIDPARSPLGQFKPNLKLNAALAGVLGLMSGIGIAFLLAFLDNTVRSPEDLEKVVAVPSLGLIPLEKTKGRKKKPLHAVTPDQDSPMARFEPMLEFRSHFERRSDIAEAFRSVRTSLMFSSPEGLPKVIMVTSTIPGEGKTTIASNLALVMADNGARILLVDADLRKHRIHKVFGIPSRPGLSEVIVSGFQLSYAKNVGIENLDILPAGITPPNPAELLGSKGMQGFLAEAVELYDHIIIDSAPLLGLADAVVLSTKVDGLIYSVHSGMVNKDNLREGIKRLRRVRAPLLGAILNYVDMDSKEYGYYGQYYYSYEGEAEGRA